MSWLDSSALIWTLALLVAAGIVAGYLVILKRREHNAVEQAARSRELGTDQPRGRYPYIDPKVCIGCGACVRACPEGDVLGLVGGLAMVVNGARCVGIGQCEKACPVGAIELAVGRVKGAADVPRLDERNQTTVPGLYVAGELGGLALVANAVRQGRDTVRWIAEEAGRRDGGERGVLDVAIVGAGPAGLAAALTATENRLSYAVLEQQPDLGGTIYNYPRRKLTHTQPVELPLYGLLEKDEYSKEELLALFGGLVERHRLALRFGEPVLEVIRADGAFHLRTPRDMVRSRYVVLALGRRGSPRKLGVPGEELPKVMYQVRDAEEYRGRRILVVGGGDSAVEAAVGLSRQSGCEVTLSYRRDAFGRLKRKNLELLEAQLRRKRLTALLGSEVLEVLPDRVRLATAEGELALANDYVIVQIGGEPPFPLLKRAGVAFGDEAPEGGHGGPPLPQPV
ncbi:MAG TPA: NAD(P)-binding domain-containing protein [Thermoanaerobaculia bacterium]|nr:NAD(P)-binding domain-containing protein [Thermoanaerobaculia bacterium]